MLLALGGGYGFGQANDVSGIYKQNLIMSCQNTLILKKNGKFIKVVTVLSRVKGKTGSKVSYRKEYGKWIMEQDTLILTHKKSEQIDKYRLIRDYLFSKTSGTECSYKKEN